MTSQLANNSVFYDEEDCLGFGVFVAELELIIGTSRDRRPDQVQLLELLQKLEASISTTDSSTLKQHQKRCEAALYDIIYKGACTVVRNLVSSCLSKLYTAGDLLPLYSKVNILQTFLQDKSNTATEVVRMGVLEVLSHLTRSLGKYLASSTVESMAIAAKAADKSNSNRMRAAGLRLAAHVVEALPYLDRNTAAVQAEAWRLLERQVKDRSSDELRAAGAALLSAICHAGASYLWSSTGYYAEEAVKLAVAGLGDAASQATREAFALALADLAVAARSSNPALAAALDAEKKPAKRQQLEKLAGGMFKAALVQPFVDAAVEADKEVLTALAFAWCSYGSSLSSSDLDCSDILVELAVKAVEMLELASKAAAEAVAKGQAHDAINTNIGACLAGGEMPAASAAVIYFIRASVIRHLAEPGQRKLLAALARATSHAIAPPVIIAALEGCGVLLEILGEVHDEAAIKAVENAAMSKLSASSTAVRHQAAAVLAALALSSPPLLARLFGDCLEGVETYCQQLMLLAAPYTKARGPSIASSAGASSSSTPGTPRGAPDSQTKHCIDGLHGNALAVGALLVASARSALGAPSRLTRSVFWIAKRMISQPYCSCPWAVAAEREAGYILLGSMCAAAAPELLTGHQKQQQIFELFKLALGPSAADALAGASTAAASDAGLELAVACWWRAAALQALSAYVLGVMGKGYAEDPAQQVRLIASMLAPLLDIINSNASLADPIGAALSPSAAASQSVASQAPTTSSTHPSPRASSAGGTSATSATQSGTAATAAAGANGSATGAAAASINSPVATAAVALLQMRLLEVFFFLPGAQFWSQCHGSLLGLCCRQLMGSGGSKVLPEYAVSVANSSLKHMLNSQDALLGPWLPGRDMLEDELRTFVGEPGGPQQHPWEVGAAFTEGFITYSQALLPPVDSEAAAAATVTATAAAAMAVGGGSGVTNAAAAAFADAAVSNMAGAAGISESGLREPQRLGVDGVRLRRRFMPYPQPHALGPALLEAQLWLLGKLLAVVTPVSQLQVLEVMLNAVNVKSFASMAASAGRAAANEQRAANSTAVALAALAGLGSLAKRARGEAGSDRMAERVLQLASCMLEDQVANACLARAGAEMMAAATAIGSVALASSQVKAITVQLSAMMSEAGQATGGTSASGATEGAGAGSSPELKAVLCLVMGSIYRVKGGVPLQSMMRAAVESLVAVASRPIGVAHVWALHGLWLVAGAAGAGYAAHVKQSLQLALELLVSSFGDNPLLQPAAARLANAMIAVLGPEFNLGSAAYSRCKTLVTANTGAASRKAAAAMADNSSNGISSGSLMGADGIQGLAATWAELEQVLYAQQLILFAPGAVPAAKHLPLLLLTLTSSRPALRRAAAATLRHLAVRNPKGLAEACIEAPLLAALDGESEPTASAQIRHILTALLVITAPQKPGYWIRLLGSVALATAPPVAAVAAGPMLAAAAGASAATAEAVDEDDDADRPVTAAAAPSPVPPSPGSTAPSNTAAAAVAAAGARLPPTPRLRTRLFAAELLLSLFVAVGGDVRHRFPKPKDEEGAAAAAAGGMNGSSESHKAEAADFLVNHLQPLIDLSYKLTTSSAEFLRPFGAQLLQHIIRFFETVADPDVPDMLLLEQYQAQFVAALRAALAPGAAPALAVCGGNLAIAFLSAGLAAGDGAVMRRLMDLLVAPLDAWQSLVYGGYAESVGVRARVALLQAHAQCANLASAFSSSATTSSNRSLRGIGSYSSSGSSRGFGLCISPSSSNNELCRSIVVKSQAAYKDLLLLLWWGVLLDYVAFRSSLPGFMQNHKSLLFGDVYPEVVEAVQGTYASAWPPVLVALASNLPAAADLAAAKGTPATAAAAAANKNGGASAEQQRQAAWSAFADQVSSGTGFAAATVSTGSSSSGGARTSSGCNTCGQLFTQQLKLQCCAIHAMLVDVSSLLLCDAASATAAALSDATDHDSNIAACSVTDLSLQPQQQWRQQLPAGVLAAAQRAAVALQALQLLLTKQHFESGLVTTDVCGEIAGRLSALAVEVLLPWRRQQQQAYPHSLASGSSAAADKVFGLVLVAAADLIDVLATGLHHTQNAGENEHDHEQQGDSTAKARAAVLEAILALSSIAVPFNELGAGSSSRQAIRRVAYLPALVSPPSLQQQLQGMHCGNGTSGCLMSLPVSRQAAAALTSICRASMCLVQQQQQQKQQQQQHETSGSGGLLTRVTGLAVRLLLTASPGDQLTSAQQLLDSCCMAAAAAGQQQLEVVAAVASACKTLCHAVTAAVAQVSGLNRNSSNSRSSIEHWGQVADATARLPALLSSVLTAGACCSSYCCSDTAAGAAASGSAELSGDEDPVQHCCSVLLWSLQQYQPQQQQQQMQDPQHTAEGGAAFVASKVLEVVRLLLQDPAASQQQQPQQLQQGRLKLPQLITAAVVPQVAVLVHECMNSGRGPLTGAELAAVTEGLKVLLLLANKTAAQGEAAQVAVMSVFVPLLIEVAKPPPDTPVTPLLRDMACKLVSAMPTSAAAAAFRTAVVALPAASKQRLQVALKEQAAAAAATPAVAAVGTHTGAVAAAVVSGVSSTPSADVKKPAIQLKMNFALPTSKQ